MVLSIALVPLLVVPLNVVSDIRTTKHNLTRTGAAQTTVARESEVCIFCHAPRTVRASALAASPPGWQPSAPAVATFSLYNDMGRTDAIDPTATTGTTSFLCLSCHDGSQAFPMGLNSIDHPYGIPYRGFQALYFEPGVFTLAADGFGSVAASEPLRSAANLVFDDFRPATSAPSGAGTIWWVPTNGSTGARRKSDLPLYPRPLGPNGEEIPFVECTSCHDPHNENALFLRTSNEASKLCLGCHAK